MKEQNKPETVTEAAKLKIYFQPDQAYDAGFVSGANFGANWEKEHSYSEQEVISMLEALRQRCAEEATGDCVDCDTVLIDKQSILSIDIKEFLK